MSCVHVYVHVVHSGEELHSESELGVHEHLHDEHTDGNEKDM